MVNDKQIAQMTLNTPWSQEVCNGLSSEGRPFRYSGLLLTRSASVGVQPYTQGIQNQRH